MRLLLPILRAVLCPFCRSDQTTSGIDKWQCLACRRSFREGPR